MGLTMASLTERLAALDTCVLSDALDALGLVGVAEGLNRLATSRKVAGRVMTVKLEEAMSTGSRKWLMRYRRM